jgi:heme A synthase
MCGPPVLPESFAPRTIAEKEAGLDINWFAIHSGNRYLVLLAAVLAVLYALVGIVARRPFDRGGLLLLRIFGGLLDLQIVLGIITLITRTYFAALIGHIIMMVAAAAVVHMGIVRLKKLPETQRRHGLLLASALVPLALMIGGILAIQRAII